MKLLFIAWIAFLLIFLWIVVPHTTATGPGPDEDPICLYQDPSC